MTHRKSVLKSNAKSYEKKNNNTIYLKTKTYLKIKFKILYSDPIRTRISYVYHKLLTKIGKCPDSIYIKIFYKNLYTL